MPKVSIIIPAYNAMRFLPQTVASALAQTWQDFELIIVNDGSTDSVTEWVSQLTDPRVRLFSQANQGLSSARNAGIKQAKGDYIALLDGDDLWEPTKLAKQVKYLDNHPEIGLIHTSFRNITAEGNFIGDIVKARGNGYVWEEIVISCNVNASSPLLRRECFETVGLFDPTLNIAEDWDMWIRMATRYQFAVIDEPLTLYRRHDNNMTKDYARFLEHIPTFIERTFKGASPEYSYLKGKAHAHNYRYVAWLALAAQNWREARDLHRQAISHYPQLRYTKNSLLLSLNIIKMQLRNSTK